MQTEDSARHTSESSTNTKHSAIETRNGSTTLFWSTLHAPSRRIRGKEEGFFSVFPESAREMHYPTD